MDVLLFFWGLLAQAGWFFCAGHLIAHFTVPKHAHIPFALVLSTAFAMVVLSGLSLIVPFTHPLSFGIGLLFVAAWVKIRPAFAPFPVPPVRSLSFGFVCLLLLIFGATFLVHPDTAFDSAAYHIPFIHSFAENGFIPLPANPENWTEHVTLIFPKGVETALGLAHQLVPNSYRLIPWLWVLSIASMIAFISRKMGLKDAWLGAALYLTSTYSLDFGKQFYVELGLLTLFLGIVYLILETKPSRETIALLILVGAATALGKITAILYLAGVVLALFAIKKEYTYAFALMVGAGVGVAITYFPPLLAGVDILTEFKIAQAMLYASPTPIAMRIYIMGLSLARFFLPTLFGIGFILSWVHFRKTLESLFIHAMLWGCLIIFLSVFALSQVFYQTYYQVGTYYLYGFAGLAAVWVGMAYEWALERVPKRVGGIMKIIIVLLLVFGTAQTAKYAIEYPSGNFFPSPFNPDVWEHVPNESSTRVLFMNNINAPHLGLEEATIWDQTTFPRMEGDPCTFWREKGITHVVYWRGAGESFQLDGGNPQFYKDALRELEESTCTEKLSTNPHPLSPIIGKVI